LSGEVREWVEKEFATLRLKSKRLESRFLMTMSSMSRQPEKSIWLASGSRSNAKAVYRMLSNEKFTKESVLQAHRDATGVRGAKKQVLLAVQDVCGSTGIYH
jgi:hypothetical protein